MKIFQKKKVAVCFLYPNTCSTLQCVRHLEYGILSGHNIPVYGENTGVY